MHTMTFTADDLRSAPELSALASLRASIDVADHAMLATYPELKGNCPRELYPYFAVRIACASAIRRQMEALAATISEFADLVKDPNAPAFLFADAHTQGAANDG